MVNPEEGTETAVASPSSSPPTAGQDLPLLVEALDPLGVRLLVVDDASPDGTGQVADDLASSRSRMSVLHQRGKDRLGRAYGDGFRAPSPTSPRPWCRWTPTSPRPGRHPAVADAIDGGADVVIGSRYVPGGSTPEWPWPRRFLSRAGNAYARWALGLPIADATGGYGAFRSDALSRLGPSTCRAAGYGFQVEMAWRAVERGLVVREIPIAFHDRRHGRSKMGLALVLEAMAGHPLVV